MKHLRSTLLALAASATLLGGCATPPPAYDYGALARAKPVTLLVLPPLNDSPEVNATPGAWANATLPLAEAGYYVLPVTLVDETFRQNGVNSGNEAHEIAPQKLREYFGADAAVYIKVKRYGTAYAVVTSETSVQLEARIVDLRTGDLLWQGTGTASSAEQQQQNQGGLIGLLVAAVVKQIVGTATDAAYNYAAIANQRMLGAPRYNGLLPGPRSPLYGQPPTPAPR
ncbi:MAG: hypothetical protein C0505_19010 [Leptothrix sp. (in: Bacteria)]|nr:hypothetical protein [Leptothrix sp. (in: b-proteobacteria)]